MNFRLYKDIFIEHDIFLIDDIDLGMKVLDLSELDVNLKEDNNIDLLLFNQLLNMLVKKGKKSRFEDYLVNAFIVIRRYFNINPLLLVRGIIVKSEAAFILDKYTFGRREKIMPRFSGLRRSVKYVLRMILKDVLFSGKKSSKISILVADSIIEYFLGENKLIGQNKEDNETARINKYSLFNRKRKKRKFKVYRKVDNWKYK